MDTQQQRRGIALMTLGGVLLGTLGIFLERAGQDPLTAVWFRCAFGAAALLAWGGATGRLHELRLRGREGWAVLAAGLLIVGNWALFFAAIERTSIGVATVVFHVQPLWLLAAGAWWLGERVSARQAIATGFALAGLALATGLLDGAAAGRAFDRSYLIGLLMCLGGSLSYAGVTLIAKSVRTVSSYALATWQCFVGAVLFVGWPLAHGWPGFGAAWGWLAGLGALHTGLAYVLLYAGIARLPAARVALLQFVYPGAAIGFDWLVYGHALSPLQIGGVALMAAALWSAGRPSDAAAPRRATLAPRWKPDRSA